MNKAAVLLAGGLISTLYSWVGPATEVLQLLAVFLGVIATTCAIILYIKKIKNANTSDKNDPD